jgi:type II secretory pathway component GspD/PulD (secretin)
MRTLLLITTLAASASAASEAEISVGHWGNNLLVTAPVGAGDAGNANRMGEKITVEFVDAPITDVVDFLRKVSSCNFVCDPTVAASNKTVTLKAEKMELRNVLSWVTKLTGVHAGYINEAIYLSEKPIEGETKTILYDVSDLIMPLRDFPGPELAFNAGGIGNGSIIISGPSEESVPSTTIEELEDLLRKHATH